MAFAGGITSNGPVGRVLLNCAGTFKLSEGNKTQVHVRVQPWLGEGLVATIVFPKETNVDPIDRKVIANKNDPSGLIYEGDNFNISVPSNQNQRLPAGEYKVILNLPEFGPSKAILRCSSN